MSAFTDALRTAAAGDAGMTTGDPHAAQRRTWGEVHAAACIGAHRLVAAGLSPGDAVAILAAQPVDVAPAAQATWLAGGSVTMLHQPTARTNMVTYAEETATALGVIGAKMIILGDPFTDAATMFEGSGIRVVTAAELTGDAGASAAPALTPAVTATVVPNGPPSVRIGEDLPALLQLTSGSTAAPKAVQITHRNLEANIESMCASAHIYPGEVMVSWLPLFHDMGMVGFLTLPMCRGVELVSVTPADFLTGPLLWPRLVSRYRGTITAAPNFAYALTARVLARADEDLDLSSLRFALNGAEPIDVRAVRAFLAAGQRFGLPQTAMVCAYGMAEATLAVSFHPWGTPLKVDTILAAELEEQRKAVPVSAAAVSEAAVSAGSVPEASVSAASVSDACVSAASVPQASGGRDDHVTRSFPVLGPPLAGIEVAVFSEDGRTLGDREVGTLHLRGECITDRYLTVDGPRPTKRADGWLDTGDLGYLVDGEVVVCGRVKDIIIMGGRNIYPSDIERVAESVAGVRAGNAAAVRWQTRSGRESFALAVESRQASNAADADRIAHDVRAAVTAAIGVRPAAVTVLPAGALPKTPSGKLKRSAARDLIA